MARDDEQETRVEYRGTGFYVGLLTIILFALALFVVAVQNTQEVEVQFLGFEFSLPLFGVAIGAAFLAVIIDELIGLVWRRRRRMRLEERAELARLRAVGARPAEDGAPVQEAGMPSPVEPDATPTVPIDEERDSGEERDGPGAP